MKANNPVEPDFAFPKQVSKEAAKTYAAAMKKGDEITALRALMDMSLAETMVEDSKINDGLAKLRDFSDKANTSEAKSLSALLQARIYCDLYEADRYKYNQRKFPLTPLASDFNEWSGDQFKFVVDSCINVAFDGESALKSAPINNYREVIDIDPLSAIFYPTLYDFVALQALDMYGDLERGVSGLVPISLLNDDPSVGSVTTAYMNQAVVRDLAILDNLIQFHVDRVGPEVNYRLMRLSYIKGEITANGLYGYEEVNNAYLKALKLLYTRYRDSEYSGQILLVIKDYIKADEESWLYSKITENIDRFPKYYNVGALNDAIGSMESKNLALEYPAVALPAEKTQVKVVSRNVTDYKISIYRLENCSPNQPEIRMRDLNGLNPIATHAVSCDNRVPFTCDTIVAVSMPTPGFYVITGEFEGMTPKSANESIQTIVVSNVGLANINYKTSSLLAYDQSTGAPIEDAEVLAFPIRAKGTPSLVGKTDKDGFLDYNPNQSQSMIARVGKDLSPSLWMNRYTDYFSTYKSAKKATIFTSLALYRPGDTMQWAVVAYTHSSKGNRVLADSRLTIILRDANYQEVARTTFTTDAFGRGEGEFVIPKGLLTGYYTLTVSSDDDVAIGRSGVTVSDYKLPTFRIELKPALKNFPNEGDVTIRGLAETYSGFPVADAEVSVDLAVSRWFGCYRSAGDKQFYNKSDIVTASDGTFEVVFPAELLKQSPIPDGIYSVAVDVVSPTGEMRQDNLVFSLSKSSNLSIGNISNIDASEKIVPINVKVEDNEGNVVTSEVKYEFLGRKDKNVVASGTLNTDNPRLDMSKVPSGSYDIRFTTMSENTPDTVEVNDVVVYRPNDKLSPSSDLLWTPNSRLSPTGKDFNILLGTVADQTNLLIIIDDGADYVERRWIALNPGMHNVPLSIPSVDASYSVTLVTVNHMKEARLNISVTPKPSIKKVSLEISSFRDKITPGQEERWTFRLHSNSGKGISGAIMLDMYNKALDQVSPHSLMLSPASIQKRWLYINLNERLYDIDFRCYQPYKADAKIVQINTPRFLTWGYEWVPYSNFFFSAEMGRTLPMASMKMSADRYSVTDVEEMEDSAVPVAAMAGNMVEESAVEADAGGETSVAGGKTNAEDYRPSEIALALFRPMLTTGDDGTLEFSFIAPNANTTWQLYSMAYTQDLLVANDSREILSSKPLMVQSNLPRFLRRGDSSKLLASVMNNSDSLQNVKVVVELFNPVDGKVQYTKDFELTLNAHASQVVEIESGVVGEISMLGYRVRATSANFTDGEQDIIPIYSSITPVIESTTFYSSPSQREIKVNLPETKDSNARFTLQFCENPIWTVVTALPGLQKQNPSTSTQAAEGLYSACVASQIIRNNKPVADALWKWNNSERSDSMLVSMLEKNADLKDLLLQATPWMVDAMSDTERMSRLALLFDRKEIDKTVNTCVGFLAKTAADEGGWHWSSFTDSYDEPSQWATLQILELLGMLKEQGAFPSGNKRLVAMTEKALKWLDKTVAADFAKYPKDNYLDYAFIRQMFPDVRQSTAAAKVSAAEVQKTISKWKEYSSEVKATAAIMLERAKYHATALEILKSLREYAVDSPTMGMTWKSLANPYGSVHSTAVILEAFATVEPRCPEIDKIRQWLILQKEALNWGNSKVTTFAVDAILATSNKWIQPVHDAQFYINDDEFVPEVSAEMMSGYLRTSLPNAVASGSTLKIVKSADTPAYGAVYCQYEAQMDSVAPASCDAVCIDKRLFVLRDGKWETPDSLALGDKVKIQLLIKSTRDMDYVTIVDERAACFEPLEQLPKPCWSEGICFYRENLDAETRMFVDRLPRGTYLLEYEVAINNAGDFITGIATIQSQYAPQMTAHSGGFRIICH